MASFVNGRKQRASCVECFEGKLGTIASHMDRLSIVSDYRWTKWRRTGVMAATDRQRGMALDQHDRGMRLGARVPHARAVTGRTPATWWIHPWLRRW